MAIAVNEQNTTSEVVALIDKTLSLHPGIKSLRQEAREAFLKLGLPAAKAEEYKHTPVTRLLQKNITFNDLSQAESDLDPTSFFIPGFDSHRVVFINGVYSAQYSTLESTPTFRISTLSDAIAEGDRDALNYIGKYTDYRTDALAAWNTAAWTNGVYIRVADNTTTSKPIGIYNVHDVRHGQVLSVHRNLFVVGENSHVTVFEKYDSTGPANHFSNTVTEAVVANNAGLDLYTIQNDSGNRYQHHETHIHQGETSRVNTYTVTLSGKLVRNTLRLSLDGEGIESHMFGLYLITGDTLADNHTVVDHKKPNSFSNEIYKGVMDGNSKGVFNGKIYVRPQAQKTNAFQANRNILLTDNAAINTKPQLEIWADDVKCSHGCTSGQLDEEAMFYLRARGINKETARGMMLYAFVSEILNNIKHTELKVYLDQLVSERLHKNF